MGFLKMFGSKTSEQKDREIKKADIKSVFLSDQHKMVHDLKTPLNGISGMVQLLRETPLNSEQSEYVGVIEESISAMLEQIGRFSQSGSDKRASSKYQAVEIRGFLQRILVRMKKDLDERSFGIHYRIDREFPIKLMLEVGIIETILLEIFDTFFSKRKKDMVIEALYESNEDYVVLVMRDKALTAEDELNSIGEQPFSKDVLELLETSSLRHSLMKTIDGKIRFEMYAYYQQDQDLASDEKTKEVSPAVLEELKEEKKNSPNEFPMLPVEVMSPVNNETILIAEDEVVGRVTLKLMLKEQYNIVFAKNGKEAVELYFKKRPKLVLMDIMMPVMNGFEAFDEIEKRDKHRVPIIACTSKVISTEREYLTSYGFDDHLDKPIENVKLDEILLKYMTE
jgi:CheY-like chemotaxis protein